MCRPLPTVPTPWLPSPVLIAAAHRLCCRFLRRPHRCRRPGGRRADRRRRPGGADLRDAGRAHARAGAAGAARRPVGRLRAAARRDAAAGAGALPARTASRSSATSAPPTRAARRCASARWRAQLGLPAPRIAVIEGDDVSGPAHRAALQRALGARSTAATSSAPTPTSAPSRSPPRCKPAPRSWSAAASPTRRSRSGPALAHFGWAADDWDRLGRATMAGHLLECGTQVSGGYYADPGVKDVPGLARPRLSDRRDRRRRRLHDHQARRQRRPRRRAHRQGATALRGARPARPT